MTSYPGHTTSIPCSSGKPKARQSFLFSVPLSLHLFISSSSSSSASPYSLTFPPPSHKYIPLNPTVTSSNSNKSNSPSPAPNNPPIPSSPPHVPTVLNTSVTFPSDSCRCCLLRPHPPIPLRLRRLLHLRRCIRRCLRTRVPRSHREKVRGTFRLYRVRLGRLRDIIT